MDEVSVPGHAGAGNGTGHTLVAGIGNIFLGDDGFGVETLGRLTRKSLPPGVDLMDAGIRGVHLAYRLLDGCRRLVLIDTVDRGVPPGTVQVIAVGPGDTGAGSAGLDGHGMDPAAVLRLMHELHAQVGGTLPEEVLVVGCQPLTTEEGIGLSDPVAAAVGPAVDLVLSLVRRPLAPGAVPHEEGDERNGQHDVAVDLRRGGGGGRGVRDGEVGAGHAPLSADATHVRDVTGAADSGVAPADGTVDTPGAGGTGTSPGAGRTR
jgi:hydrogenase maturation protease